MKFSGDWALTFLLIGIFLSVAGCTVGSKYIDHLDYKVKVENGLIK